MISTFTFKIYLSTLGMLLLVDVPWIMFLAKNFYLRKIGHLMRSDPSYVPAVIFYLMYSMALLVFVVLPLKGSTDWRVVFVRGFFFGLVVYSAYNLTNQATLRDWPLSMTIVDMTWGATLSGVVSTLAFLISLVVS